MYDRFGFIRCKPKPTPCVMRCKRWAFMAFAHRQDA